MSFELRVVARGDASGGSASAASMLDEPIVATTATGTVVVPPVVD